MRPLLIRAGLAVALLAQVHTALPRHAAHEARICRTSTASTTCSRLPTLTVPAPVSPSWTRA